VLSTFILQLKPTASYMLEAVCQPWVSQLFEVCTEIRRKLWWTIPYTYLNGTSVTEACAISTPGRSKHTIVEWMKKELVKC